MPESVALAEPTTASLLAALVAFGGWLCRTVYRDWQAKRALTQAILGEVRWLVGVVERHRNWFDKLDEGDSDTPLIPFATQVFDRLILDVRILEPDLIRDVVEYYGYVKFANAFQRTRGRYNRLGRGKEFNAMYLAILNRLTTDFRQLVARHLTPIGDPR